MVRRHDMVKSSTLPSRRKSKLGRRILQIRLRKKEDNLEIGTRHFPHQELDALPADNPFRANALELLFNLRTNLEVSENIEEEERELIMRLSPLYQERLSQATQSGVEQGLQQGREQGLQQGERLVVENLLRVRFGVLDEEIAAMIESVLALSPEEFTPLLLQLSREELLTRFGDDVEHGN